MAQGPKDGTPRPETGDGVENGLDAALGDLVRGASGDWATVGDVLDSLERRGFGPFIALLAALVCTPVGAIPGLPAIVGAALVLFASQLLIGRRKPWFPGRLRALTVPTQRLAAGAERLRPWVRRLTPWLRPRLSWAAEGFLSTALIALAVIINAVLMILFGFIPFMPFFVGLPIVLFGIGLTARDGVVTGLGYGIMALAIWGLSTRGSFGFL
ncbi:MAG: exopolysaccharide biosynthesis protein [Pseudomonadota bacterium]